MTSFTSTCCLIGIFIVATLTSALLARENSYATLSQAPSTNNVQRRVSRQAPNVLSSSSYSVDSPPRENSPTYHYLGDPITSKVGRFPSNPPPQRTDYYGVGGRLPQGNSFSTPEDRLITNRNPSIVTVVENAMSRVFLPIAQALARPTNQ